MRFTAQAILLTLLMLAGTRPSAQEAAREPAAATGPAPGHETEAVTIAKQLQRLRSPDPEQRKTAVSILGKYRNPAAMRAVIDALKDPDPTVRYVALLATTESTVIPPSARPALLALIGDERVETRRLASSCVQQAMSTSSMFTTILGGDLQHRPPLPRPSRPPMQPATRKILTDAFSDPDAVVRRNMLAAAYLFRDLLTTPMIEALLRDPDREVRIRALSALRSRVPIGEILTRCRFLVKDPDPHIRQQLARAFAYSAVTGANQLLRELTEDEVFAVSTEAYLSLLKNRQADAYAPLRERLDDSRLEKQQATDIIRCASMLPNPKVALRELMRHDNAEYRYEAARSYAGRFADDDDSETLLLLLNDRSARVRSAATSLFARKRTLNDAEQQAVIRSPHTDVRLLGARMAGRLPQEQAEAVLMELLLDDAPEVRLRSVTEICRRQLPDWQAILDETLKSDREELMRFIAIAAPYAHNTAFRDALLEFAAGTRDRALQQAVLSRLPRKGPTTIRPPTRKTPGAPRPPTFRAQPMPKSPSKQD